MIYGTLPQGRKGVHMGPCEWLLRFLKSWLCAPEEEVVMASREPAGMVIVISMGPLVLKFPMIPRSKTLPVTLKDITDSTACSAARVT